MYIPLYLKESQLEKIFISSPAMTVQDDHDIALQKRKLGVVVEFIGRPEICATIINMCIYCAPPLAQNKEPPKYSDSRAKVQQSDLTLRSPRPSPPRDIQQGRTVRIQRMLSTVWNGRCLNGHVASSRTLRM